VVGGAVQKTGSDVVDELHDFANVVVTYSSVGWVDEDSKEPTSANRPLQNAHQYLRISISPGVSTPNESVCNDGPQWAWGSKRCPSSTWLRPRRRPCFDQRSSLGHGTGVRAYGICRPEWRPLESAARSSWINNILRPQ
jgi:hypothetical protein